MAGSSKRKTHGLASAERIALTEAVRDGWASFLARYRWDVFATLTYSGAVWSSEKVVRNFSTWLFRWQLQAAIDRGLASATQVTMRDGYGRVVAVHKRVHGTWWNQFRKRRAHPVWVLGIEPHESGRLHAHALIKWSSHLSDLCRKVGWGLWFRPKEDRGLGFGRSRLEPPRSQEDVAGYVSKYVVKGGEIYLSPSFDAARLNVDEGQRR